MNDVIKDAPKINKNKKIRGEVVKMNFSGKRIFITFFVLAAVSATVGTANSAVGQRIRIGILPFDNKAKGISVEQADVIADVFTRELVQSKTLSVI